MVRPGSRQAGRTTGQIPVERPIRDLGPVARQMAGLPAISDTITTTMMPRKMPPFRARTPRAAISAAGFAAPANLHIGGRRQRGAWTGSQDRAACRQLGCQLDHPVHRSQLDEDGERDCHDVETDRQHQPVRCDQIDPLGPDQQKPLTGIRSAAGITTTRSIRSVRRKANRPCCGSAAAIRAMIEKMNVGPKATIAVRMWIVRNSGTS